MSALGTILLYYPGLAPRAMKGVALAVLIYVITTNQLLGCFDAVALAEYCSSILLYIFVVNNRTL